MAGKDNNMDNDLNMGMLHLGDIDVTEIIKEEVIEEKEETHVEDKVNDNADDNSQESVGDDTDVEVSSETDTEVTTESPASSDEVLVAFVQSLADKGLLSVSEKDLKDLKDENALAELMSRQIKSNEYADLNEMQKGYLDSLREGIPSEVFHKHATASQAYDQLTDDVIKSNPEVRKDLIIQGYLAKGFDNVYAQKMYQRVSDSGEDVEEAIFFKVHLKSLQDNAYQEEVNKVNAQKEQVKEEQKQRLDELKDSVYSKKELFEGFKVGKGMQDKVFNLMTKPVAFTKNNEPINAFIQAQQANPVEFNTNLYYLFELTDGFKNLGKLNQRAVSKASKNLRDTIQNSNFISGSQSNPKLTEEDDPNVPDVITDIVI